MALAKRTGPDFLFLANAHSQKFKDIEANKEVNVSFQDTKSQDWISVSGTATTASNSDPRIKEVWSRGAAAWFGDVGDGVHDGSAEDPRMSLIEVKAKCKCSPTQYPYYAVLRCGWKNRKLICKTRHLVLQDQCWSSRIPQGGGRR